MSQDQAAVFHALHRGETPLVLFNVWDAVSARVIAEQGAEALATSSWAMAHAMGLKDGEAMTIDAVLQRVGEIRQVSDLPLSVDLETGYSETPTGLAEIIARLIDQGVIGINLEDQKIGAATLRPCAEQARRIEIIRAAAERAGVDLFSNARTDVWFFAGAALPEETRLPETTRRAAAYGEAGANGIFVPGVTAPAQLAEIAAATPLPVNAMVSDVAQEALPDRLRELAAAGVRRISTGPGSYRAMLADLAMRCGQFTPH